MGKGKGKEKGEKNLGWDAIWRGRLAYVARANVMWARRLGIVRRWGRLLGVRWETEARYIYSRATARSRSGEVQLDTAQSARLSNSPDIDLYLLLYFPNVPQLFHVGRHTIHFAPLYHLAASDRHMGPRARAREGEREC
jgi:hypothetical protein